MHSLLATALSLVAIVQGIVIPDQELFSLLKDEDRFDTFLSTKKNNSRIAIIGSGITGATAAYRLAERFRRGGAPPYQQPTITVFERNEVVGGRITQAYAYNDTRYPIDTCAATFSALDTCVAQAVNSVGLSVLPIAGNLPAGSGVGVWDGEKFVGFVEEDGFRKPNTWSFFRKMKYYRRYDTNPWTTTRNAANVRSPFSRLLMASLAPELRSYGQGNLSKAIENAALQNYLQSFVCAKRDGEIAFPSGEKGARFVDEILDAAQRERFFGGTFDLNVLEFLFSYEDAMESAIDGGNLRLIDRLLRIATDDVRLGTEVKKIETKLTGDINLVQESITDRATAEESFDAVIIATSLERSALVFDPPLEGVIGLGQEYKDSFVTHFTTRELLNASYFNRQGAMPQRVYTTQSKQDVLDGKEEPLFLSLQLVKQLQNPDNGLTGNYLFKLVSRQEIPDAEIEKMILGAPQAGRSKITWIDRRPLPQSVPISKAVAGQCKVLLEKIEVAPNIYYAGAGEQVVGSAEFGCRMGLNAANLILEGEERQG